MGPFLKHDMPDVAIGEDISCANFFQLDGKWVLLCISHFVGCRYYIGDWDAAAEQFVPEKHGRMNWRRPGQSLTKPYYRDFFAPESVLTSDGRRVMWAWLRTLDPEITMRTVQSLPRELSLGGDGHLRIEPLRELESLPLRPSNLQRPGAFPTCRRVPHLRKGRRPGRRRLRGADSGRTGPEAERKRFGIQLFADDSNEGLQIMIRPETGTLCVGETEAPFAVADLPEGEDVELRVFIDKYLVEVFANGRQAALCAHMAYRDGGREMRTYLFGRRQDTPPIKIRRVEIWKLRPANQGFLEARENRIWAPDIR